MMEQTRLFVILSVILVVKAQSDYICPNKCLCNIKDESVTCYNTLHSRQDLYKILQATSNTTRKLIIQQRKIPTWEITIDKTFDPYFGNLPNLQELKLASCGINRIEPKAFSKMPRLKKLILQRNKLDSINVQMFNGIKSLEEIDISYNRLKSLPADSFQYVKNLTHVLLSSNMLTMIEPFTFNGLSLTELDLNDNVNLTDLDSETFNGAEIEKLYMSGTNMKSFPIIALRQLSQSLQILDLDSQVDGNFKELEDRHFIGLDRLQSLSLSYNQLRKISPNSFAPLKSLNDLKLAYNDFREINDYAMNGTTKLKILSLEGNRNLELISNNAFGQDSNIEELIVSRCRLRTLNVGLLKNLSKLRKLDMNTNKITIIPQSTSSYISSLELFSVTRNPLHCNCQLLWLQKLVRSKQGRSIRASCKTPKAQNMYYTSASIYKCSAPNISLSVNDAKPRRGQTVPIKVGQPVTLTCEGHSDPAPSVTIKSPVEEITTLPTTNTSIFRTVGIFTIQEIKAEFGGKYTCIVSNVISNQSTVITLSIQGLISPTSPPKKITETIEPIKEPQKPEVDKKGATNELNKTSNTSDTWPAERYVVIFLVLAVIALIVVTIVVILKYRQLKNHQEQKGTETELTPINGKTLSSIEVDETESKPSDNIA